MKYEVKRRLTLIIICVHLFSSGWEIGLILPTLWAYLQSLGSEQPSFLGFVIAGFSCSAALSGLIVGRLSDKFQSHTKTIILVCILVRIVGNFQYTLGISVWNILIARCICGLAASSGPVMMAELCRVTEPSGRTALLSICKSARQIGILISPGFQILFSHADFSVWGFRITPLNAPGLSLTIFCVLIATCTLFMFHGLTDEYKELTRDDAARVLHFKSNESETEFNSDARNPLLPSKSEPNLDEDLRASSNQRNEFCSWTFIVLNVTLFTLFFCQVGLETTVPVIMQSFGYGEFENSLVYMGGGLAALTVFLTIYFSSKKVPDTVYLSIGMFSILFAFLWLLIVFRSGASLHSYLIGVIFVFTGYPLSFVSCSGLSSKYLSNSSQGLGQAIASMTGFVGLGLGPTWAGMTVGTPYLNFGLAILIVLVNAIMIGTVFKRLRKLEIRN